MGFLEEVEKHFGTKCLYTAFGVSKDADAKVLKKAYHKLSLIYHPDRSSVENKENHKCKFQTLSKIHMLLTNTEQRAVYDETGELIDESDITNQERDWEAYWRILFKKVSKKDIEKFEKEFKGTVEEKLELKKYYLQFEGDMDEIMNNVLCSTDDDEERFCSILQKCIDDGELPAFDNFMKEDETKRKKRKKQATNEAQEAEQHAKDLGITTDGSVEQLILQRRVDREKEVNSFFNELEAKYCKPKQKKVTKATATTSKSSKRQRK